MTGKNEIEHFLQRFGLKIERIRALLPRKNEQALDTLRTELTAQLTADDYFTILEARSMRIQNRVGPILKGLSFQGEAGTLPLLTAINHFKERKGALDKNAPLDFLKTDERAAVTDNGRFRVSLYKAFLFLHTQSAIKSGTLNLEHSYKYRPLDD